MGLLPTFFVVGFTDSAERTAEVSYRSKVDLVDDGSNMDDVIAQAAAVETALNVLTWDHISYVDIKVRQGGGGAAANVAANNQVYAFLRALNEDGQPVGIQVPAWDDLTYDQDSNNLLSPAFGIVAQNFLNLIVDPDTLEDLTLEFAQSRAHKSRGKKLTS